MENINTKKFLFYFAYILWLIVIMCQRVYIVSDIKDYVEILVMGILLLLLFSNMKAFNIKILALVSLTLIMMIISYRVTKFSDIFFTGLFILAAKDLDERQFFRYDLKLKIIIMFSVFILYFLGFASTGIMIRDDGTIRNSFGFAHPNVLGLFLFSISCDIFYLNYGKFRVIHYLIILSLFFITLYICDSRSAQICIVLLLIFSFTGEKLKNKRFLNTVFINFPIILFVISLVLAIIYPIKANFIITLDNLFSTRIRRASEFLNYYGVNLFGNYFKFYGQWSKGYYLTTLDNAYMHILIHYGIFTLLIFLKSFKSLLKYTRDSKNYSIYFITITFLIYGLMERHIMEIEYNSAVICLGTVIYKSLKNINMKKE